MSLSGVYLERFLARIDRESGAPCWLWRGAHQKGYPETWNGVRPLRGHRVAHELWNGPIPAGYEVDHLCFNPGCVNPEHLEAVPPHINNARSRSASAVNSRKTHCVHGHEFTPENTIEPRPGHRRCRECERRRNRESTAKRDAKRAEARAERRAARAVACAHGHAMTPENTYTWTAPNGRVDKLCRTCRREAVQRRAAAIKER